MGEKKKPECGHKQEFWWRHKKSWSQSKTLRPRGGGGWIRTTEANATDLQSAPFGHSGTPPYMRLWSWWTDSNPRPADYKSAALPAELHQRIKSAVQQQVLFYQRTYTLSSLISKFIEIFLAREKGVFLHGRKPKTALAPAAAGCAVESTGSLLSPVWG